MSIHIVSNGLLLLVISILFAWLSVAKWRRGMPHVAGLWAVMSVTFFRFSGRFVERGGGPAVGIETEWVITANYLLILGAAVLAIGESVWKDWKERME